MIVLLFALFAVSAESPQIRGPVPWIANSARPGRWFPQGVILRSETDWVGILEAEYGEGGTLSERPIRLEAGKERFFYLPVIPDRSSSRIVVRAGKSQSFFPAPPWSVGTERLLLVPRGDAETLRASLAGVWGTPEELAATAALDPADLPLDLYALDAIDLLFVSDAAASALPPEGRNLLLRWASIRGRLFSGEKGRQALAPPPGLEALVEAPESLGGGRQLPIETLPPDSIAGLRPRDFAGLGDTGVWMLLAYVMLAVFWIGRGLGSRDFSKLALAAGVASVLQAIPGIGWPAKTPPWRVIVAKEGSPEVLIEDWVSGRSKPMLLNPDEILLLPKCVDRFRAEWGKEARFSWLDSGTRRFHSALILENRGIESGAGGNWRNRFAALESVSWVAGDMALMGYRESLSLGEILPTGLPPQRLPQLPRPLRDFLGAGWVSGEWLAGRLSGEDPTADWRPSGQAPHAVYLLWFPRAID